MTHINKELLRCFLFHSLMLTGQLRDFASPSLSFQTPLLLLLPASPELLKYESPTPFCNSKHFKRRQLYSVLSHFLKAARVINTFGEELSRHPVPYLSLAMKWRKFLSRSRETIYFFVVPPIAVTVRHSSHMCVLFVLCTYGNFWK